MWPSLRKFHFLFPAVKLKLGHNFSQFILDSKLGLLNVKRRLYLQRDSQRKLGFLNVALAGSLNFSELMGRLKIGILQYKLELYFQDFSSSLNSWICELPLLSYFVIL